MECGNEAVMSGKKVAEIVARVQATLSGAETARRYRLQPTAWTRRRNLSVLTVVTVMLTGHKRVLQHALNRVFQALGRVTDVPQPAPTAKRGRNCIRRCFNI
jgi:hypothetical protein